MNKVPYKHDKLVVAPPKYQIGILNLKQGH
jgi:hypothetical protein